MTEELKINKSDRILWLYEQQGRKCYYCKREFITGIGIRSYSIDHKTPSSRGGKDTIDNVCLACCECNSEKGDMTEEEYLNCLKAIADGKIKRGEMIEYRKYLKLKKKYESTERSIPSGQI